MSDGNMPSDIFYVATFQKVTTYVFVFGKICLILFIFASKNQ